jgi:hypothetical protein
MKEEEDRRGPKKPSLNLNRPRIPLLLHLLLRPSHLSLHWHILGAENWQLKIKLIKKLTINGQTYTQSMAITHYLGKRNPNHVNSNF